MLLVIPALSHGAIRVEDDEVIFTYRVPAGKAVREVFLVGDFNNWNATMEKMVRDGDVFEMSLFLVEGNYHYKFVVDGEWVVDSDNPGTDPARGSPLALVEQTGGLTLSTEESHEGGAEPTLVPDIRYIGAFREGENTASDQRIDLSARFSRDRLRGRAVLTSTDDTWRDRPGDIETEFNRGFIEVDLGAFQARGYERDTVWAANDPAAIIGNDGLYDYNPGFDRHGLSLEYQASDKFVARMLYDDQVDRPAPAVPALPAPLAPDTSLYEYAPSSADADRLGLEIVAQLGKLRAGYVRRSDRGLHPGRFAHVAADTSVAFALETRENRSVTMYWLRTGPMGPADALTLAFGTGASTLHEVDRIGLSGGGGVVTRVDRERRFEKTRRVMTVAQGSFLRSSRLGWRLAWDHVRFEFDDTLAPAAEARVHRTDANVTYRDGRWHGGLSVVFTHQNYGSAPVELHIDDPARNPWLNARDRFSVPDIVGLDERDYTVVQLTGAWGVVDSMSGEPAIGVTMGGVLAGADDTQANGIRYSWAQATAQWPIRAGVYVEVDGRFAQYDKPAWQLDDLFASGYVEVGYRRRFVTVNFGWGFDALVFDPVINDYARIGRTETLRQSLAERTNREAGASVGSALLEQERAIESTNAIKVECVVRF